MLNISGSIYINSEVDTPNLDYPIVATSSGHIKLDNFQKYKTLRPNGRQDYQLLYVAQGLASFNVGGKQNQVTSGQIVLYYPFERQEYSYTQSEITDVYWIHFTGSNVSGYLKKLGLFNEHIYQVYQQNEYLFLFRNIMKELQLKRANYIDLSNAYFKELLLLMSRRIQENQERYDKNNEELIKSTVEMFNFNYNSPITISEYARQNNISDCWFTKLFKKRMGMTPQNYLINIRINKAKELLISSAYNVAEISEIVGYQNPLYFSRLFKKYTSYSPTEYRQYINKKG